MPGAPKRNGYLTLGLRQCAERIELRKMFRLLRSVQDAFEPVIPARYFQAMFDDEDEAQAMHELHRDRVRYAQEQQPKSEG